MQRTADGRRGWQQWSEHEAKDALAELDRGGESLAAFARRKGVSAQRLRYWRKRVCETSAPAFVAVSMPMPRTAQIEIASSGVTVRVREGVDVELLARLVEIMVSRGGGC